MIKKWLLGLCLSVLFFSSYAICVKNNTNLRLYYEIKNRNIGSSPKQKFHSGILENHQEICHDHSSLEGDDWKTFRKDFISIWKINDEDGHVNACSKLVLGVLNTLDIEYFQESNTWLCIDKYDEEE